MQRKWFLMFSLSIMVGLVLFAISCQKVVQMESVSKTGGVDMRIVVIPKAAHTWFDDFANYARLEIAELGVQIGRNITIDYCDPISADVAGQNFIIIQQAVATGPTGIAIDLLDYNGMAAIIEDVRRQSLPVVFFDSEAPDDSGIPQIGSPSEYQARIVAEYLAKVIDYNSKEFDKSATVDYA
jgi:ABC-type sugar transport system substrate-binding protein